MWSFDNLPKYRNGGEEIVYTIIEDDVYDYTTYYYGYDIFNSHIPEIVTIEGSIIWNDHNNQDGLRPEEVTIRLYADDMEINSMVVTEEHNWMWSFDNLPKYRNQGIEIVYTITEDTVAEYETIVDGYDVTNTHNPETISISGSITWDDCNDQDGIRPEEITIRLYADGMINDVLFVTADRNWAWSFSNLPKYEYGMEIVYTIYAEPVEGYTTEVNGYDVTNIHMPAATPVPTPMPTPVPTPMPTPVPTMEPEFIINSGTCGTNLAWSLNNKGVLTISGEGKMKDYNHFSGSATPSYAPWYSYRESITSVIIGNGVTTVGDYAFENCTNLTRVVIPASVTSIDYYAFYNCSGLTEITIPGNVTYIGFKAFYGCSGLTSVVIPDSVIEIGGTAFESCTNLTRVVIGNGVTTIGSSAFRYCDSLNDLSIGENVTEIGSEAFAYCTGLTSVTMPDKVTTIGRSAFQSCYNLTGITIPDSVTTIGYSAFENCSSLERVTFPGEDMPEVGSSAIPTTAIIVCHKGSEVETWARKNDYKVEYIGGEPETISISGSIIWDDNDNQDGIRPEEVTITLYADDMIINNLIVTEEDEWMWIFTDLDKYWENSEIVYTIRQEKIKGYVTEINGYDVTNSYTPEETEATVVKVWDDADNQDGIRPESLTVTLSNGTEVTLNEANEWTATVENLPKYAAGVEIEYTWTEGELPEGYALTDTSVNGTVTTLTNSHTPEETSVSGTKTWNDNNNQDGKRPEFITINLLKNGEVVAIKTVTAADGWAWSFTDLDKYEASVEITYTITEDEVEGYTTEINGYDVTNSHTPEETEATVVKVWDDAENQDGIRPESLIVTLSNGETVTLSEENEWTATVENLPKYADGVEIEYTWTEGELPEGYELTDTSVNGTVTTLTNSHTPEKTEATIIKLWDDADNQDGKRPETLTVTLSDGTEVALRADNNWTATVADLHKYENGEVIEYTWTEGDMPEGYTLTDTSVNGTFTTLTNSYIPEITDVSGSIIWNDHNNQDGLRPEEVTIRLYADDMEINSMVVTEEHNWMWSFTNLPKYRDQGMEIVYRISADETKGYVTEINGYDVTNIHTPTATPVPTMEPQPTATPEPGNIIDSGTCGYNLTWTLDDKGVLTISGEGDMDNYYVIVDLAPWNSHRESITSVVIGEGITHIGKFAFYKCTGLTGISIPESVTSIGEGAFSNCSDLKKITIPDSVTEICRDTFSDCSSLVSVDIGANVTDIDYAAFKSCTNLTQINLPDGLINIGQYAFNNCQSLEAIELPDTLENINSNTFSFCSSLKEITLPEGIIDIPMDAFSYCSSLEKVTLSENVYYISSRAFSNCTNLEEINLPDILESISSYAFSECTSLKQITLPGSLLYIGEDAFVNCSALEELSIPASVVTIDNLAFYGCTGLEKVTFAEGLNNLGRSAFQLCTSLTEIALPESLSEIGEGCFSGCTVLEKAYIPDSIGFIPHGMFFECSSLTQVDLPETVTAIEGFAFAYCSSLEQITIPDGTEEILNAAFAYCTSLEQVTLPSSVTSIGASAFAGCTDLAKITFLGKDMPEISDDDLDEIDDEVIPTTAVIVCHKDSDVETWAKDNGYEVEYIGGIEATPEPTAVPTPEPTAVPTPEPTAVPTAEPNHMLTASYSDGVLYWETTSFCIQYTIYVDGQKLVSPAVSSGSYKITLDPAVSHTVTLTCVMGHSTTYTIAAASAPTAEPTVTPAPTQHPDISFAAVYFDGTLSWTQNYCGPYDLYVYTGGGLEPGSTPLLSGLTEASGSYEIELDPSLAYRVMAKCAHNYQGISFLDFADSEFTLPAALTVIDEEAFAGTDIERVVVPASVTEIGSRAFADCKELHCIVFEGDSITIAEDAFKGCGYVVFVCAEGSDAEIYSTRSNQFGRVHK